MNDDFILKELKELKKCNLIAGYKIIKNDINEYEFIITILEGEELYIKRSVNMSYLLNDKHYECFEQILTKFSDLYIKEFSKIMMNKLSGLNRDDSCDSDD
jgi:hypothetical protein